MAKKQPNVNSKIHSNAIKVSVDLARYEESVKARVTQQLMQLQKNLIAELASAAPKTDFKMSRLNQLLATTTGIIEDGYAHIAADQNTEMINLMRVQTAAANAVVNDAVGVSIMNTNFSETQLAKLAGDALIKGAPSADWWARASKGTTEKFSDVVRQGMMQGDTIDQMVSKVKGIGGVIPTATRQAAALVRTSVQTAANDIRLEVFKQNQDIFDGIMWVSTLDDRTTDECMALDGLEWDNNLEPIGHDREFPGEIAHWGCRSTQVPILKKWEDLIEDPELAKKLDAYEEEVPGTRASMNGEVSDKMNYEDWLKSRPESEQVDILGPGKWQMWKDDKLTWSEMVDPKGRPLSLKELEMQYNLEGSVGAAAVSSLAKTYSTAADSEAAAQSAISAALSSSITQQKQLGVTGFTQQLIKEGKTNAEILAAIKEVYPNAKSTMGSISSIKSVMKAQASKGVQEVVAAATAKAEKAIAEVVAQGAADVKAAEDAAVKLALDAEKKQTVADALANANQAKALFKAKDWEGAQVAALKWQALAEKNLQMAIAENPAAPNLSTLKMYLGNAKFMVEKVEAELATQARIIAKAEAAMAAQELADTKKNVMAAVNIALDAKGTPFNNVYFISNTMKQAEKYGMFDQLPKLYEQFKVEIAKAVEQKPGKGVLSMLQSTKTEITALMDSSKAGIAKSATSATVAETALSAAAKDAKLFDMAGVTDVVKVKPTIEVSGVTSYTKALLLEGHDTKYILEAIAKNYPDAKSTYNSVATIKSKMKAAMGYTKAPKTATEALDIAANKVQFAAKNSGAFKDLYTDSEKARQWLNAYKGAFNNSSAGGLTAYTSVEKEALKAYTGSYYHQMNAALRSANQSLSTSQLMSRIKAAEAALWKNPLPGDVILYRGVSGEIAGNFWKQYQAKGLGSFVGQELPEPAFASTSFSRELSNSWGGSRGTLFEIRAPKGTPGAYVRAAKAQGYADREDEWLLPPGAQFRIVGAEIIKYGAGEKLKLIMEIYYPRRP